MTRYEAYKNLIQDRMNQLNIIKKEITGLKREAKKFGELGPEIEKKQLELSAEKNTLENEINELRDHLLQYLSFSVDEDLKIGYLKQKPFSTAKSDLPVMIAVDEFEELIGKRVYNFTLIERDELLMMKFKNTTMGAVNSTMSKIKGYVDYCVRNGAVVHMQNIFDTLTKTESIKFVSQRATELRYISPEKLKEFQNKLYNAQDKLLIELPYVGVRGRTRKGCTLEELINLRYDPGKDYSEGLIILERNIIEGEKGQSARLLKVPSETIELIEEAYKQDKYISNNGVLDKRNITKETTVNNVENYVFRAIGKNKFEKLNPVTINARFQKIQQYCGNQFITIHNLYMSGMISRAIQIYKNNGEITVEDYLRICEDFRYGETPEKYYLKVKQDVNLYLKGEIQNI